MDVFGSGVVLHAPGIQYVFRLFLFAVVALGGVIFFRIDVDKRIAAKYAPLMHMDTCGRGCLTRRA